MRRLAKICAEVRVRRVAPEGGIGRLHPMVGPLLSVLLFGIVPVWGVSDPGFPVARDLPVAAPVAPEILEALPTRLAGSLSASGVIIVDLQSAETVYADRALQPRPMASLTKLMTALIIVEHHTLDERVSIPAQAANTGGSTAGLQAGDEYALGDLLSVLLVHSANDAAVALAVHHSGTVSAFVEEMNARAASLGLEDTSYVNPTGFDAPQQHSTPRDVALLSSFVLRIPALAERMALPSASIVSRSGTLLTLLTTHQLLRSPGPVVAGKTGTTDGAGQCLLSVVEEGDRRYAVVLLSSSDRYGDMRRILSAFDTK